MFEQALAARLEAEEVQTVVAVAEELLLDPLLTGCRPKHAPAHTTHRTAEAYDMQSQLSIWTSTTILGIRRVLGGKKGGMSA